MPSPRGTVVDPHHWLTDDGKIPPDGRIRGKAIRVAQCIEYGASLSRGEVRETLIPCRWRPDGIPCSGLMVVFKNHDDSIHSFCDTCDDPEFLIHDWQDTRWAKGPPPAERIGEWADRRLDEEEAELELLVPPQPPKAPMFVAPALPGSPEAPKPPISAPPEPQPLTVAQQDVAHALSEIGSTLSLRDLSSFIATAPSPMAVLQLVVSTARRPTKQIIDSLLPKVFELWNETPRPELGGMSPNQAHVDAPAREPARAELKPGRNAPCPCGSGKKYKRCCGSPSMYH